MSALLVRDAQPSDYAAWRPLWDGYNAFYGRQGETALPEDVTQCTWRRFFDAYEPMHAIVAECEGALLGIAQYLFHRSSTQIAPNCYLQDLFTAPDARGRGVGRALIEGVYARAQQERVPRVYWQTRESNATAMALYDRLAERSGFLVYRKMLG